MEHQGGSIDHQLLLAQSGWVQGLAHNLVSDPAGAEDVAQDTMLAALTAPPLANDDERSLRAWLTRVATNLANLTRRRASRRQQRESWVARPAQVGSAAEAVERASQLQVVVQAVLGLDEPYRSAVLMRFYDGLTPGQIAERTGASPVAVRKRISRGLERLRARMDRDHDGERASWMPAMLAFAEAPNAFARPVFLGAASGLGGSFKLAALLAAAAAALILTGLSIFPQAPEPPAAVTPLLGQAPLELPGRSGVRHAVRSLAPELAREAGLPTGPAGPLERHGPRVLVGADSGDQSSESVVATTTVRGRVVDLFGRGLPGLDLVAAGETGERAGEPLGRTAWDGSFAVEWAFTRPLSLGLSSPAFVSLREPRVVARTAAADHLLVATRAVHLSGWVSDLHGRPVPDAVLRVEVPGQAFLDLGLPLDATAPASIEVRSGPQGAFTLPRVPALECARLETRADGFEPDQRAVPLLGAEALTIRLGSPALPTGVVHGLVVLRTGEPAVEAEVRLGREVTHTDSKGRFTLPTGSGSKTITAHLAGWEPGQVSAQGGFGSATPPRIALGARLYSITGKLAAPQGAPLSGWVVSAGTNGMTGAAPGSSPVVAGSASSGSATTTATGAFTLTGLPFGSYELWAVNPGTLEVASGPTVVSGTTQALVQTGGGSGPAAVGKLLDPFGRPVCGALMSAGVFLPGSQQPLVVGPAVLTGPGGAFVVPGGAGAHKGLLVGGVPVAAPTTSTSLALTVVLPPVAHVVFDGSDWSPRPEAVRLLDKSGALITLQTPGGVLTEAPLFAGKSLVLGASESATWAVAMLGGVELDRLSIQLVAGEVVTVGLGDRAGGGGSTALAGASGTSGAPQKP